MGKLGVKMNLSRAERKRRSTHLKQVRVLSPGQLGQIRSPSATISPTIRDLEWAAGFLEGEGAFGAYGNPPRARYPRVSASQVNPAPLLRLQQIFGGRIRQYPH